MENENTKAYKKKINRKVVSKYVFVWAMLAYPMILFLVFYIGVNAQSIIMSFQKYHLKGSPTFVWFDNFKTFIKDGTFERFTHVIDTTDALFAVSEITEDKAFRDKCIKLSEFWRGA